MLAEYVKPTARVAVMSSRLLKALRRPGFALQNLRYHIGIEPSKETHVFVMGPPRSGTTLVMRLLSSHSRVTSIDAETNFFMRWNLLEYEHIPSEVFPSMVGGVRTSVELFDCIAAHQRDLAGAKYFLEKTPEYALRINFLREKFPRSKFVFVVRDGRDGFLSALRNPRMHIRDVKTYALLWKKCARTWFGHIDTETMMDIKYENLCSYPMPTLGEVMKFLGEELEAQQLAPALYGKTSIKQNEGHQRLARAISSETVGEWRRKLAADQVQVFTEIAGRELRSMGYEA